MLVRLAFFFFFFNDTATTEIYTLSLHDALPIWQRPTCAMPTCKRSIWSTPTRSEEHTSELQSLTNLVCRLLLEKKKKITGLLCRCWQRMEDALSQHRSLPA